MTSHAADAVLAADVAQAVLACISDGRHDDIAAHLAADFVFELPYGGDFGGPFDKASFDGMQRATFKMFTDFHIAPTQVHECADASKVIIEYESTATVVANNRDYRNRYIGVFEIADGLITRWREFHNPDVVAKAFAP